MNALIRHPDWDSARLAALAELALDEARRAGMSDAEVAFSLGVGLTVNVRLGEVETLEHHRDQSLGVTVYAGRRKGSASSGDVSEKGVREAVAAAVGLARYTAEDPWAGPPEPEYLAKTVPDLDLYHPWALTPEAAIELARRCEDAARAVPGVENSEGASVGRYEGYTLLANSRGFLGGYPASQHSLSCAVIAGRGDAMQRDHAYSNARHPDELEAAEAVGRRAGERAVARLGARRLPTGRVPVVFEAPVARGLLGHLVGALRGSALYRRASFLLDKKGERVFAPGVRIHEEPHRPRALGSAPFDAEGVATVARDLVADGVLLGYLLDSYSARRLGMQPTGHAGGVHNLMLEPGEGDLEALLRRMGRGLLVTELMGQGVNLVTGDYSRGAAGFWVEDGAVQYPVQEITIAGNLAQMFAGLVDRAADVDRRGAVHSPSVLVESLTVAGD